MIRTDLNDLIAGERDFQNCYIRAPKGVAERIKISLISGHLLPRRDIDIRIVNDFSASWLRLELGPGTANIDIRTEESIGLDINTLNDPAIIIEEKTTINQALIIADNCDIHVGVDNQWSAPITIQGNDQHAIFDLRTGEMINGARRQIAIGDHVWLGRHSVVKAGVKIGKGSIVGLNSLVTKDLPEHCIAGGVPARVLRRDAGWQRNPDFRTAFEEKFFAEYESATADNGPLSPWAFEAEAKRLLERANEADNPSLATLVRDSLTLFHKYLGQQSQAFSSHKKGSK